LVADCLMNLIEQALKRADKNTNLIPPYLKLEDVKVDMESWKYLTSLCKELEHMFSLLNDTAALKL